METKRLIKDDLAKERKTKEFEQEVQKKLENGEDLYPCCDTSIWLRSCQKEVTDPLKGKITVYYITDKEAHGIEFGWLYVDYLLLWWHRALLRVHLWMLTTSTRTSNEMMR
uniref:Uncharacterized protein n=1 Tax=Timema poppense TaxID=170557 RepID=A0A7R9DH74_TIMPO|nr:unnamed protein product [Timema poppensis]